MPSNRSDWKSIILAISAIWIIFAVVVFFSPYRQSANILLPVIGVVVVIVVLVIHGLIGSAQQRDQEIIDRIGDVSRCAICKTGKGPLHIVIYESYIYLLIYVLSTEYADMLCEDCARRKLKRMLAHNVFGCILFPPYILWAYIRYRNILSAYKPDKNETDFK
jgi:uncharacterized protein YhhL (DUF1145 family)